MNNFKFFRKSTIFRFSHYCSYDNAKYVIETLTNTDEWETTVFPKEYPHSQGVWRVLYIQRGENQFTSLIYWVPRNQGYITDRFMVNIDL